MPKGVMVRSSYIGEEVVFPHVRDWYVTDDGVLQLYQPYNGDNQFVVTEYASGSWERVQFHPPVGSEPQPEAEDGRYDENGEEEDK